MEYKVSFLKCIKMMHYSLINADEIKETNSTFFVRLVIQYIIKAFR